MIVGIVGSEKSKFTPETERSARACIRELLAGATAVCSGHCHLGGIDIWAEEEADKLGLKKIIFPPKQLSWESGYKPRNLKIANTSDIVYCITVLDLPKEYNGMRFDGCYHCLRHPDGCKEPHVKSGGCWTALKAKKRGWRIIK